MTTMAEAMNGIGRAVMGEGYEEEPSTIRERIHEAARRALKPWRTDEVARELYDELMDAITRLHEGVEAELHKVRLELKQEQDEHEHTTEWYTESKGARDEARRFYQELQQEAGPLSVKLEDAEKEASHWKELHGKLQYIIETSSNMKKMSLIQEARDRWVGHADKWEVRAAEDSKALREEVAATQKWSVLCGEERRRAEKAEGKLEEALRERDEAEVYASNYVSLTEETLAKLTHVEAELAAKDTRVDALNGELEAALSTCKSHQEYAVASSSDHEATRADLLECTVHRDEWKKAAEELKPYSLGIEADLATRDEQLVQAYADIKEGVTVIEALQGELTAAKAGGVLNTPDLAVAILDNLADEALPVPEGGKALPDPRFMKTFGGRMRTSRIHADMSMSIAAGRLNILTDDLRKIEDGEGDTEREEVHSIRAADAFGVSAEWLLTGEGMIMKEVDHATD